MNKSILLLLCLIAIALTIFFWPQEQPEITRVNELKGEAALTAISAVKNVCAVSALGKDSKLKQAMIATDAFSEYKELLDGIKSPAFDKARVLTPSFNSEICYVYVPEDKNCTYQFTMRKKDGNLLLESICRKEN